MQENNRTNRRASLMLTMEPETKERLRMLANQHHTNISQMITNWAWSQKLKPEPVRGESGGR